MITGDRSFDHERILAAIRRAEQGTSGEIRVMVSGRKTRDPVYEAELRFQDLGMTATEERNGVLIFLCPPSRSFAVVGDKAIHAKCGQAFWWDLADALADRFRIGEFTEGLIFGIERIGQLFAAHFPRRPEDRNELPDNVARL